MVEYLFIISSICWFLISKIKQIEHCSLSAQFVGFSSQKLSKLNTYSAKSVKKRHLEKKLRKGVVQKAKFPIMRTH